MPFNLQGAELAGADLRNANLQFAVLNDADLHGADLRGTWLDDAGLIQANLSSANLERAHLAGAKLGIADLRDANLRGADLVYADLTDANLDGADLADTSLSRTSFARSSLRGVRMAGARMWGAVIVGTDLSSIAGLASVTHGSPSIVDEQTLRASPDLPDVFLRGVGLSDDLISLYRSWGGAVRFYSSFISYSRANHDFASRLHDALQANGVRTWLDSHDLAWGAKTRRDVFDAIRVHEKLIVVLSEESLASDWVESEVEEARRKERETGRDVLFPVRIDDAIQDSAAGWARDLWNTRNVGDMTGWHDHPTFERQFAEMLRWLRAGRVDQGS
ncbi:MAG: toll/interleukin-1 receptor domain-containing protein [Dehalococcoidia bacterium]